MKKTDHLEVKVARIEEGIKGIHEKIDEYHQETKETSGLISQIVKDVHILKRDRWWIFILVGFCSSLVLALLGFRQ